MKKKQILSLLLAFVLCLGLFPVSASAAADGPITYLKGTVILGGDKELIKVGNEVSVCLDTTTMTATVEFKRTILQVNDNVVDWFFTEEDAQEFRDAADVLRATSYSMLTGKLTIIPDYYGICDYAISDFVWEGTPYPFSLDSASFPYIVTDSIYFDEYNPKRQDLAEWADIVTTSYNTDPPIDVFPVKCYKQEQPPSLAPTPTPEQPSEPPSGNNAITYTCYKDADDVSYDKPNQSWVKLQNDGTFEMQLIRSKSPKTARGTWENVGPTDKPEYVALKVLPDTQGFDQKYTFTYNSDGNLVSDTGNLGDVPKGSVFSVLDSSQGNSNDSTSLPSVSTFSDVPRDAWYAQNVQAVAEMGLFSGKGDGRFAPNDRVTIAETMKLAAELHAELNHGDYTFRQGTPWYAVYEEYLNEAGGFPAMWMYDYNSPATRDQLARMMEGVLHLLPEAEQNKNTVVDSAIPDVPSANDNSHIYGLYRAGILTGSDSRGNFQPNSTILRSEVAAIMHRFIDPAQRKSIELPSSGAAGNAVDDGDQTGFVPPSWSWEREGTEGYDRSIWTGGKYVREDGKAVLYIESSDSWDFFSFVLHTMADGGKSAFTSKDWNYGGAFAFANTDGDFANDPSNGLRMTWQGDGELTVDIDWIDTTEAMYVSPVGIYHLVREK